MQAGIEKIPVFVEPPVPVLRQAIRAAKENLVRVNVSPVNQGYLFLQILKDFDGCTQEDLAAELGKDRSWIALRIMAARAAPDVQAMLGQRPDGIRVMTYLNRLESEADRAEIIARYISGEYTTRMVAARVEEILQQAQGGMSNAPLPAKPAAAPSISGRQNEGEAQGTSDAADDSPAGITPSGGARPPAQGTSSATSPLPMQVSAPNGASSSRDQREALPQSAATQGNTRLALIVRLKESLDILQSYRRARGKTALTETEVDYLQTMAEIVQELLPKQTRSGMD